jgi:hypothetical protein
MNVSGIGGAFEFLAIVAFQLLLGLWCGWYLWWYLPRRPGRRANDGN